MRALATTYQAPQSDLEHKLVLIWQMVLKVEKVGIQDNFFDLGGNSLLIAQAHQRVQAELGVNLSLVDLFKYPSIGLLAQWLSQKDNDAPALREQVEDDAQKRRGALNRRKQLAQKGLYRENPEQMVSGEVSFTDVE
jgi:aryl carrier-like protein